MLIERKIAMIKLSEMSALVSSMTNDELTGLIRLVNARRDELNRNITRSVTVGDSVEFMSKYGRPIRGRVEKVNRKTLVVRSNVDNVLWRVTASLAALV